MYEGVYVLITCVWICVDLFALVCIRACIEAYFGGRAYVFACTDIYFYPWAFKLLGYLVI